MRKRTQNPHFYEKCRIFGVKAAADSEKARGRVTEHTKHLIVHEQLCNLTEEGPAEAPSAETVLAALEGIRASLAVTEDSVIEASKAPPARFKRFLRALKRGDVRLCAEGAAPVLFTEGEDAFSGAEIRVNALRERGGTLFLSGGFVRFFPGDAFPVAFCGERSFESKRAARARRTLFFVGVPAYEERAFSVEIPSEELLAEGNLRFVLRTESGDFEAALRFGKNTGMRETEGSFFAGEQSFLTRAGDGVSLRAERISDERLKEALASLAESGEAGEDTAKTLAEYLRMRPLLKGSRIWLFSNGPRGPGSNAERMFAYAAPRRDGTDKRFVTEDGRDALRLYGRGETVERGSDAHRMLFLFAEKLVVPDIGEGDDPLSRLFPPDFPKGLFNGETVLLPDGFLAKEEAERLAVFADRVALMSVASETERQTAVAAGFSEEAVHAAGSPASDGLADRNGRRILFMPAHREKLCVLEGVFDENFASSAYCRAINELLCDGELFDALEELGYAFDFVPHARTHLQISDFEMDGIVNIVSSGRSERSLFEEASLLVTDCLPVFETAYMKKPVIYFRFAEEEGLPGGVRFDDETTFPGGVRFGEVAESAKALAEKIAACARGGCAVPEVFARKAGAFFAHADGKSRERIYGLMLGKAR
jgi:hypothetical protein